MCAVSFVGDFYGKTAPPFVFPYQPQPPVQVPVYVPWPQAAPASLPWTQEAFDLLKEVMEKLKVLDAKLGMEQCEDPEKTAWMKAVEDRLAKIEKGAPA